MTTAAAVLAAAIAEMDYIDPRGDENSKFGDWYGMPNAPWCAMFVSWCLRQAGIQSPYYSYCPDGINQFKGVGMFSNQPAVGAAIFYDWNGDGVADHTGLVERIDADGTVHTIEGNRGADGDSRGVPCVERHTVPFDAGWGTVLGFGHINYTEDDMPLTADDLTKITTIAQEQADQAIQRASGPSGVITAAVGQAANNINIHVAIALNTLASMLGFKPPYPDQQAKPVTKV